MDKESQRIIDLMGYTPQGLTKNAKALPLLVPVCDNGVIYIYKIENSSSEKLFTILPGQETGFLSEFIQWIRESGE